MHWVGRGRGAAFNDMWLASKNVRVTGSCQGLGDLDREGLIPVNKKRGGS